MARILVSHPDKLIWVAVAKAASMVMHVAMLQKIGLPYGRWREAAIDSIEQVARMHGYFRFAFVRNPWARLFSCYVDKIVGPSIRDQQFILGAYGLRPGMPFEDFVRRVAEIDDPCADEHFVSQFYSLAHRGRLAVDYVGRFENLPGDWNRLRTAFDLPEIPFTPVGSNRRQLDFGYHKPHYSPELAEMVARRYADDIRQFGYVF
jgi:hypothetical protein